MYAAPCGEGLFLGGKLLFDFAPGADLETPAHPTQRFRAAAGRLVSANRALCDLLQAIGRNRPFRSFQYLGRNDLLLLQLWLPSHRLTRLAFTMADLPRFVQPDLDSVRTARAPKPISAGTVCVQIGQ